MDSIKAMFLSIILPNSWDTFCITINNFAPAGGLIEVKVASNLLREFARIMRVTCNGNALNVRGRPIDRGSLKRGQGQRVCLVTV